MDARADGRTESSIRTFKYSMPVNSGQSTVSRLGDCLDLADARTAGNQPGHCLNKPNRPSRVERALTT